MKPTSTPDVKVKDQCSYKVWMEQQEDWREVEWKEKELYNPCMLSQILCSDASPAKSTVRTLPQILHIHAIWMSRSDPDCSVLSFWIHRPDTTARPSGSILVSCVCAPKPRSCFAATMGDILLHSPDCEIGILLAWRICARLRFWRHLSSTHSASGSHVDGPPALSGHSVSSTALGINPSCPLYLLTHLLGLCESLARRGRASLFLETCHRPRYDGSGTESIVGTPIDYLRPFANEVWQGIHAPSHRQAAGWIRSPLRWNS